MSQVETPPWEDGLFELVEAAPITDPIELAARWLADHKGLRWEMLRDEWREEQRVQVRGILDASGAVLP